MRILILARPVALALATTVATGDQPVAVRALAASGGPVAIEATNLSLDQNAVSTIRMTVTNVGQEAVTSFHARVYVHGSRGLTRGFVTRRFDGVLTPSHSKTVAVPLDGWFLEPEQEVAVAISDATTPSGLWRLNPGAASARAAASEPLSGDWEQLPSSPPVLPAIDCPTNFCASERAACISMCGQGCVYSFQCNRGECSSDCVCKTTPSCNP